MAWTVLLHKQVMVWQQALTDDELEAAQAALELLQEQGPDLGRPLVDRIKGSELHNLKELRPLGTNIRMLFAFDRARRALVVVAGDKTGDWKRWYVKNVPIAEQRFRELDGKDELL